MRYPLFFLLCFLISIKTFAVADYETREVDLELEVGDIKYVSPAGYAGVSNYNPTDVTSLSVTTETGLINPSTSKIVKATKSGKSIRIEAVGEGKCRVVGSCHFRSPNSIGTTGIATVIFLVTVKKKTIKVSSISLNKDNLKLFEEHSERLLTNVLPVDADNKTIVWSSQNPDIATVSSDGCVSAVFPGKTIVEAATTDGSNIVGKCNVTVIRPITNIILDTDRLTIEKGDKHQINYIVLPETATIKDIDWLSSDSSIASVSESGEITANEVGSTIIVANAKDGSDVFEKCLVIVKKTLGIRDMINAEVGVSINNRSFDPIPLGSQISVFSIDGALMFHDATSIVPISISLPAGHLYILRTINGSSVIAL